MPVKNKNYDGVNIYKKVNNKRHVSSCTLNVSSKEARDLNFVDVQGSSFALKKEIINNSLVVSLSDNEKRC